jgi:hypothetical protein
MSGIRYSVVLDINDEIISWCEQQFGMPSILGGRWFALEFSIQFREESDRNWFLLRWGNNVF